jgi:hypothetical protein
MPREIEWRFDRSNSRPLRLLSYAAVGALGSLIVAGLLARLRFLETGAYLEFVVFTALLLAGPAVYGIVVTRRDDGEEADGDRWWRPRWLGVVTVVPGVALYGCVLLGDRAGAAAVATAFAVGIGSLLAVNAIASRGRLDPATETLHHAVGDGAIDLASVAAVRSVRIGPVAFVWLTYDPGVSELFDPDTRRFLVTTPTVAATARDVATTAGA